MVRFTTDGRKIALSISVIKGAAMKINDASVLTAEPDAGKICDDPGPGIDAGPGYLTLGRMPHFPLNSMMKRSTTT